jgi:hypothetical protein
VSRALCEQIKIIAFVIQRSEINAILNHFGLPSERPKIHRARGPPQAGLWGDKDGQEITYSDATTAADIADQDQLVDWQVKLSAIGTKLMCAKGRSITVRRGCWWLVQKSAAVVHFEAIVGFRWSIILQIGELSYKFAGQDRLISSKIGR